MTCFFALELNKDFKRGRRKGAKCYAAVRMNLRRYERTGNRRQTDMIAFCNGREPSA